MKRFHVILSEIAEYTLSNTLISLAGSAIVLTASVRPDGTLYSANVMKNEQRRDATRIEATIPYRVPKDHSGIKADPYSSTRSAYSPLS